ncbi:MAG TPA: hypothetical protein VLV83_01185 [Acidobacteriota bacterium]|nr:hypothetical protein [Acidobacteriota bacterium]
MTCNEVEALLLEDRRACHEEEVRRHLKVCPACRSLSQELEDIEDLSYKLGRTERAPQDFSDCLLEKAASIRASRSRSVFSLTAKPLALLAACFLIVVGAAWIQQESAQGLTPGLAQEGGDFVPSSLSAPGNGIRSLGHETQAGYVDVYFQRPSQEPQIVRLPDTIQVKGRQVNYARAHSY